MNEYITHDILYTVYGSKRKCTLNVHHTQTILYFFPSKYTNIVKGSKQNESIEDQIYSNNVQYTVYSVQIFKP